MLPICLLVFNLFIGAHAEVDSNDFIENIVLKAIQNNKTIYIDFGDSDEKPLRATFKNAPMTRGRISEQKCHEYITQMENREKGEKYTERYRLHLVSQVKKGVFDEESSGKITLFFPILGGIPAMMGEFPHMGAIGWRAKSQSTKWVFKCGGSLISKNFILTGAHCSSVPLTIDTDVVNSQPEVVRLGVTDISDDQFETNGKIVDVKIKHFIAHPKYASPKRYYDIALIELDHDVKFDSNLQPACLWISEDLDEHGPEPSITGWGTTSENGQPSKVLLTATVPLIHREVCDELLLSIRNRNWHGLMNHQICAGNLAGGVDTCQGDSGGPIQRRMTLQTKGNMHRILGVTSFGRKCGRPNEPTIYTRVSSFIDWIEENVWKENYLL